MLAARITLPHFSGCTFSVIEDFEYVLQQDRDTNCMGRRMRHLEAGYSGSKLYLGSLRMARHMDWVPEPRNNPSLLSQIHQTKSGCRDAQNFPS
jgi:hypothetical protein